MNLQVIRNKSAPKGLIFKTNSYWFKTLQEKVNDSLIYI